VINLSTALTINSAKRTSRQIFKEESAVNVTYEFGVSRIIEKQVFWFEVTIDNCIRVKITDGFNYARAVETRCRVVKIIPAKSNTTYK